MSAEELREAAALMRERAEAAGLAAPSPRQMVPRRALAVARAYLGRQP